MGIFLSEINQNIQDTINYRQQNSLNLRTNWLNNKSVWVKATSLVQIGNDSNIRLNYILYGGMKDKNNKSIPSGYKQSYDKYNKPLPGITNVSITNKGSMGSTREATINYTIWDLEQLDIMEKLYMTPGMSILLEWGWNIMANDDNTPIDSNLSDILPMSDRCMTKKIIQQTDKYKGHYDGMQGQISQFNWTLNQNGGFDCTTTIISIASMFLDMSIHSTTKNLTKPDVDNERVLEENTKATLRAIVDKINNDSQKRLYIDNKLMGLRIDIEMNGYEEGAFQEIDKNEDHHYFVTWEFFEKYIINDNLSLQMQSNNECDSESVVDNIIRNAPSNTYNPLLNSYTQNQNTSSLIQGNITPKLNSDNSLLSFNGIGISADPLTCLVPINNQRFSGFFYNNRFVITDLSYIPDELKISPDNNQFFNLSKILVNLRVISELLNSTETLNELLTNLLQRINEANGNPWELGIIIDEYQPDIIKIVDYKVVETDKIKSFLFKVYNKDSIVKTVDLSTNVDESIKAEIMYGTNAEDDNVTNSDKSVLQYNFYGSNITNLSTLKMKPMPINSVTNISDDINQNENTKWDKQKYYNEISKIYNKMYLSARGYTPELINDLKNLIKKGVSNNFGEKITNTNNTINTNKFLFLPLKLTIKLDGISGLHFGNVLNIDYLPDRYKKRATFQITNITHDISTSGWETTIETVMRINETEVEYSNYDSPSFKDVSYKTNDNTTNYNSPDTSPILKENKATSNIIWILDSGHGYNISSNYKRYPPDNKTDGSGVPQLLEYKFTRQIVNRIVELCDKNGINYYKLINTNEDIPINVRIKMINTFITQHPNNKIILLSIHGNAVGITSGISSAAGVMTIISPPIYTINNKQYTKKDYQSSKTIANIFYDNLNDMWINNVQNKQLSIDNRVNEQIKVGIIYQTNCPALLTENGFYTNPIDRKFMLSEDGQNLIAQCHINSMIYTEQNLI